MDDDRYVCPGHVTMEVPYLSYTWVPARGKCIRIYKGEKVAGGMREEKRAIRYYEMSDTNVFVLRRT